jgi:hypothetical protein
VQAFGAKPKEADVQEAWRCFNGTALLRARATVAHDSYERLVEVACSDNEHRGALERSALKPIAKSIQDPATLGVDIEKLSSIERIGMTGVRDHTRADVAGCMPRDVRHGRRERLKRFGLARLAVRP